MLGSRGTVDSGERSPSPVPRAVPGRCAVPGRFAVPGRWAVPLGWPPLAVRGTGQVSSSLPRAETPFCLKGESLLKTTKIIESKNGK